MDQHGRITFDDGLKVYGALRGIKNDMRKDADYEKRNAEDAQYKTHLGNLQKDENYQPDMDAPDYDPAAMNKALLQNTLASVATEEGAAKKEQYAQQRIELQRNNVSRGARDAMAIYQSGDQEGGMNAMLKVFDFVHPDIDLVKDENGNPLVDEQGQITLQSINGKATQMPRPEWADMVKMAQSYTDPETLKKADAMSQEGIRAANASAIASAKHYKNGQGQVVAVFPKLYDPIDPTKKKTIIADLRTGQEIDPADFASGDFREVSHENREKFDQQLALKGIERKNSFDLADHKARLKGGSGGAGGGEDKTGVGSATANRQLEIVMAPFSKGQIVDQFGEITQDGKAAIQRAQEVYDSYRGQKNLTLTQKRELSQAESALKVYSTMHDQVTSKWAGRKQTGAEPGGDDATVMLAQLTEMGLSKEAIIAEMEKRFPGINVNDQTNPQASPIGAALGGPPVQQQQAPTQMQAAPQQAPPQQAPGQAVNQNQIKSEFQALAQKHGKDAAKQMIIQKYPNAFRR